MSKKKNNTISIAIGKNDSDIQKWLRQYPVSKKRYHFSERLESVLAGTDTKPLTPTRELENQKDVRHILYEQKVEYENTNRYINYLLKRPELGGLSTCLKLLVRGVMIVEKKDWIKESAHIQTGLTSQSEEPSNAPTSKPPALPVTENKKKETQDDHQELTRPSNQSTMVDGQDVLDRINKLQNIKPQSSTQLTQPLVIDPLEIETPMEPLQDFIINEGQPVQHQAPPRLERMTNTANTAPNPLVAQKLKKLRERDQVK